MNQIDDDGAEYLADALQFNTVWSPCIVYIYFDWSKLSDTSNADHLEQSYSR